MFKEHGKEYKPTLRIYSEPGELEGNNIDPRDWIEWNGIF